MKLSEFITAHEAEFPLSLAADWDPVGLQIEPRSDAEVTAILLALDFTSAVVTEAIEKKADLIIAYHPPLFEMPKPLIQSDAKARNLMRCVEAGIAVYSPHTILDATPNGVTDWLAASLGEGTSDILEPNLDHPNAGHGRLITLSAPTDAQTLAKRIQSTLSIPWVRTALPASEPNPISTIAVCPGAGHSVVETVKADAILTGEMRHHDLLAAQEKEQTVFLCEHGASERGFLNSYAEKIRDLSGPDITITLSEKDQGPLTGLFHKP